MQISSIVTNEKQLNIVVKNKNINEIVLDRDCFSDVDIVKNIEFIKKKQKKALIRLERISRYDDADCKKTIDLINNENVDGIILQNFDSLVLLFDELDTNINKKFTIEIDYGMNIINRYSKDCITELFLTKIHNINKNINLRFVSPVELNSYELNHLKIDTLLIYGYIPTMVTANCLFKTLSKCDKKSNTDFIKDRMNNNMYFRAFCRYCYNKIYNISPLYLLDIMDSLKESGFDKIRYDFSIENEDEMNKILSKNYMPKNFTRGHIKNKIV